MINFRRKAISACVLPLALCILCFLPAGCTKKTAACNDENTIQAVSEAHLESMKQDLMIISGYQPGSELKEEEWNLIKLGMHVRVDNIKQKGESGGRYQCTADLVINQKDSVSVSFTSELAPSGEVKVEIEQK